LEGRSIFEPRFPSLQEIDLDIKMTILCNYKRKKEVMIQEVDMNEEEATEPMDDMIETNFENLELNDIHETNEVVVEDETEAVLDDLMEPWK
jgi:hypothetical protein